MKLTTLYLNRNGYNFEHDGVQSGCMGGSLTFELAGANATIKLNPEQVAAIVEIAHDAIVYAARAMASELRTGKIDPEPAMLPAPIEADATTPAPPRDISDVDICF